MPGRIARAVKRFSKDDRGAEVIEYALVLGLVIIVAIVAITAFGGKVLARWQSVDSSL